MSGETTVVEAQQRTAGPRPPCPLCGSPDTRPAQTGAAAVVRCGGCGLVRSLTAARTDLYDDDYYGVPEEYFARAGQWRFEAARRLRWLLSNGRPQQLLEIGCAGGFFLDAARAAGIDGCGVELSRAAATYACDRLRLPVTTGAFEDVELGGTYDAVCAFHVLEHVERPLAFLEKASALLRTGGVLALEVPNIESRVARSAGARWHSLQPDHHRWHFSEATLVALLHRAGFAPIRVDTVFARYYCRAAGLAGPFGLANLVAARTPRVTHRTAGDFLRVLARKATP